MIADKMYPSFYLLELAGKAIEPIIPGDFGIEKIALGSTDYANDMLAHGALERAMRFMSSVLSKEPGLKEEISFNPEFFPTLQPLDLTDEQKLVAQRAIEAAAEMQADLGDNQIVVPLTNSFDPIGDFITTRWVIEADDLKIEGRVAVQPQFYLIEKRKDSVSKSDPIKVH